MTPPAGWVEKLQSSTGLRVEPTKEEVDGVRPRCVVEPDTPAKLGELLSFASQEGLGVIPRGGGTFMHLGNPPSRADILLSTASLRGDSMHSPEDLVATVSGGLTIAEANFSLRKGRQHLPLDPPMAQLASIGGTLAANVSGPRGQGLGRPRDSLLGVKVVLSDGSVTKAGGRVVKNVAGYDLGKLYVGSLGTLGVIVEATFKLRPVPEVQTTLAFSFPTIDGAVRAGEETLETGLEPSALTVVDGPLAGDLKMENATPHLLVEFGDLEEVVRRQVREVTEVASRREGRRSGEGGVRGDLWERVAAIPLKVGEVALRVAVPPADVEIMVADGLETLSSSGAWNAMVHSGLGIVYFIGRETVSRPTNQAMREVRALSASLGGHTVVERAPTNAKAGLDVWGPESDSTVLMRRLKEEFDPAGVLNPGRFVGGI